MASNLNKAFMRAYAKERQGQEPVNSQPVSVPQVPASNTPAINTPVSPMSAHAVPTPALDRLSRPAVQRTQVNPVRSISQPVTDQPVNSQSIVPQPNLAQPNLAQPNLAQRMSAQSAAQPLPRPTSTASPVMQPTVYAARYNAVPPSVANATPAPANTPAPIPTRAATQPIQSRPAQTPSVPAPQPQAVRPAVNTVGDASEVWRRIDGAHAQPTRHPTNTNPRESISVQAAPTTKRMHAAAPAPAAPPRPQPAPAPQEIQMPFLADAAAPIVDDKAAESRRRTVADFLYSAGQYNPGRVLASAEAPPPAMDSMPAQRYGNTTTGIHPIEMSASAPASATNFASDAMVDQAMPASTKAYPSQAMPTHPEPMMPEPLPRRMGQILRVDVPRTHSAPAAIPATPAMPVTSSPATNSSAASAVITNHIAHPAFAPASNPPAISSPINNPSVNNPPVSNPLVQPVGVATLDASTAKYVIEQRRLDRAHKLNEAEEKLRTSAHKIFNPVWEVDNLQWPAVVDKLMQQRADSMAHVAAHLKGACQDGLSVLGVTSAGASEGRTTVACCLARLAAMHGINVALVDLDLDRPTLCIQTNMEIEQDWRDCLGTDTSLEEVAVHSLEDQLTMLPLKPRGSRPGLLASDGRIAQMLSQLSESFELVIVDCSRTNSAGNVITGLAHTQIFDAAIVVVDRRDANQARVEDAVRLIQQTGIESIGIVDNFSA